MTQSHIFKAEAVYATVASYIADDRIVMAIKSLREHTNCGLKEALDACRNGTYRDVPVYPKRASPFGLYTQSDLESLRERCAKVAEDTINEMRDSDESDLRSARSRVTSAIRDIPLTPHTEEGVPDWDDLRGVAPDATGDLSSEAFICKQRDEWGD